MSGEQGPESNPAGSHAFSISQVPNAEESVNLSENSELSIAGLTERLKKIEDKLKKERKDFWDKLSATSALISGVIVAIIGFYATQVYDTRSRELESRERDRNTVAVELQTVEKFLSHLASKDETEKQAAIEAISSLANPELATKMAKVFGGSGARAALTSIATAAPPEVKASVDRGLGYLYKEFASSVVRVKFEAKTAGGGAFSYGTGFVISKDGYVLTAQHLLPDPDTTSDLHITLALGSDSPPQEGTLVAKDVTFDVALVKMNGTSSDFTPLRISDQEPRTGDNTAVLGFPEGEPLRIVSGMVTVTSSGQVTFNASLTSGFGGSPILNNQGEVVGIVARGDSINSVGLSLRFVRSLLQMAGLR